MDDEHRQAAGQSPTSGHATPAVPGFREDLYRSPRGGGGSRYRRAAGRGRRYPMALAPGRVSGARLARRFIGDCATRTLDADAPRYRTAHAYAWLAPADVREPERAMMERVALLSGTAARRWTRGMLGLGLGRAAAPAAGTAAPLSAEAVAREQLSRRSRRRAGTSRHRAAPRHHAEHGACADRALRAALARPATPPRPTLSPRRRRRSRRCPRSATGSAAGPGRRETPRRRRPAVPVRPLRWVSAGSRSCASGDRPASGRQLRLEPSRRTPSWTSSRPSGRLAALSPLGLLAVFGAEPHGGREPARRSCARSSRNLGGGAGSA